MSQICIAYSDCRKW